MANNIFIRRVGYSLIGIFAILWAVFYLRFMRQDEFVGAITGGLIMSLHFLVGLQANRKGLGKNQEIFMIFVFGGMMVRLFLAAALIIFCLSVLKLNFYYLIFSTFIFYLYFLILEVWYLLKNEAKIFRNKTV